ncbi:potassium-transporting ATPase subunit KdpA [Micrococcales bacterium 31B]|nr:potassium-transporting ATPase subunit KdpA [Micrococcales bacterium 31B]
MQLTWTSLLAQLGVLVVALGLAYRPLGVYLAHAASSPHHLRAERGLYRIAGVDADAPQTARTYLRSVLAFSLVSIVALWGLQLLQGILPGPLRTAGDGSLLGGVDPYIALNTAISFVTNTNWQTYVPEQTVGIFVQMALLAVQNFLSAAVGICVCIALIRGITRDRAADLGNFWVDLARITLRVLLPGAILFAVVLLIAGVPQTWGASTYVNDALGVTQAVPGGPVASQEAIKILGTNGGGYFNANSVHPLENPNAITSWLQVFMILVIPFALPSAYGRLAGDARQGLTLAGVMGALWLGLTLALAVAVGSVTGEGFEQRFGPAASALFASATTLTSTGAVNVAHDSLPPLAGGLVMLNMMLGEVAPGGVGSGLYGMLILALIAVFIAGLMVGRTPEFVGKRIGPGEMKLAALYILVTPTLVLVLTALTVLLPDQLAQAPASGPHQFSEVLYAFTSTSNNNGSAFGGITTSGPFLAVATSLAMLLGRFVPIALVLILAGRLGAQQRVPASVGTVPTHGPLFGGLLLIVTVILTALSYFPALALGPLAEGLTR